MLTCPGLIVEGRNLKSNFHFFWIYKLSVWLRQNVENVDFVDPWSKPNFKLFHLANSAIMYVDLSTDHWRKANLESNFHFLWIYKLSVWLVDPWSQPNFKLFPLACMFEAARQQRNNVCWLVHWPMKVKVNLKSNFHFLSSSQNQQNCLYLLCEPQYMYILGQLALVCLVICFAELVYGLFG